MCGICGKLTIDHNNGMAAPVTRAAVEAMCRPIYHRGPDDQGVYADGIAGIGMRRLSIIDLKTGSQPIHNENRTVWVVANGEIYNFKETRCILERRGHHFHTNSDVEVIVHLYEEHGEDFVKHLNGMFGIALWDTARRRLILARDRLGIKPLHYALQNGTLLFASELKSMLAGGLSRDIDPRALSDYLSYNYIPAPRTIYKSASKLEPGHMLIVQNGAVRVKKYWDLPEDVDAKGRSEAEYCEMIREQLKISIKRRLMSDVPLGVFLSGGVDSTTLVALSSEVSNEQMRTFTIDFGESSFSESELARKVAGKYQTRHREQTVDMKPLDILPTLAELLDEPFADSSAIPTYYVSKMAREDVTVVLGGDGGDELFAGYMTYTAGRLNQFYSMIPKFLRKNLLAPAVSLLPVSHRKVSLDFKAKRFVQGALRDHAYAHYMWKLIFDEEQKAALSPLAGTASSESYAAMGRYFQQYRDMDRLRQWQFADTKVYLPDDILTKVDRMTMGNSLEGRVPFLDHEFVEMVARMPSRMKMMLLTRKYILKKAMEDRLPREILYGKKQGFSVPMAKWLRNELSPAVHDYLNPTAIRRQGIFDPDYVSQIIEDHNEMRIDYSRNIWGLLMFSLWHDRYGKAAPESTIEDTQREIIEVA